MPPLLVLCACVAVVLGNSQPQYYVSLFEQVDKNNNGELTIDEFSQVFMNIDAAGNNNKKVEESEMVKAWVDVHSFGSPEEAKLIFTRLDMNDNGLIEDNDVPYMFEMFDTDESSAVSSDEFLTVWGSLVLS